MLRIVFFDKKNKRNRVLERDKRDNSWHVHVGYFHTENSEEGHGALTKNDKKILERATKKWHNYLKA